MSYSDFKTLDDIRQKFGVTIHSGESLFKQVPEIDTSENLLRILEENVSLALNINTEKARSELIIAPLLVELRRMLGRKISLFSGIDFTVNEDLTGYCDFLLSYSSDQAFLEVPVVCIVEAKNETIKTGYAQCMAEMIAARTFNAQKGHATNWILGVVTTGSNWKFLKFENNLILIDFDEYMISQVNKILGIFVEAIHHMVIQGVKI